MGGVADAEHAQHARGTDDALKPEATWHTDWFVGRCQKHITLLRKICKNMSNSIRSSPLPTDLKADVWLLASFLSSLVSGFAQGGLQVMYLSFWSMTAVLSDTCGLHGLGFMVEFSLSAV